MPFALHCDNTKDDGSRIGAGSASSAGTGGDPSGGGRSGVNPGGFGGLDFGWASEPDAGDLGNPDGGALTLEGCGDGIQQSGEACDDGNGSSGDGCSATCGALEQDFACPAPGAGCVSTVRCGDGAVTGAELCDDGNAASGDGCGATCTPEAGWTCRVAGARCEATECGDGVVAGDEDCEDGNAVGGDGCVACERQPGFACVATGATPPLPASTCHTTRLNDGTKEGDEACDDGNDVVGDGCNPFGQVEPSCDADGCHSACGDGMRLPDDNEACDDGNTLAGDGCSATCQVEAGFRCTVVLGTLPDVLELPVTFRDFIASATSRHPDFETRSGEGTPGLVLSTLGDDKKPVYTGICPTGAPNDGPTGTPCPYGAQTSTEANFNQWYRDVPSVNKTFVTKLAMDKITSDIYQFPPTLGAQLFPLEGRGWVLEGSETTLSTETAPTPHNFGFTSEIRHWFEFKGGERLTFSGDDDVWVFINGKLALDLGGLHPRREQTIVLGDTTGVASCTITTNGLDSTPSATPCPVATRDLDLSEGSVYEVALFHAERHTGFSNFDLTLGGFVTENDACVSVCGDGVRTPDEVCDDGVNNTPPGVYGTCDSDCRRGPSCGDGTVQTDAGEVCDDGYNLNGYGTGCAPGCKLPASCGDGEINGVFGEECDDGVLNDGHYGGCTASCRAAPRCGDGTRQEVEACDDGNLLSGDGCSNQCFNEGPR